MWLTREQMSGSLPGYISKYSKEFLMKKIIWFLLFIVALIAATPPHIHAQDIESPVTCRMQVSDYREATPNHFEIIVHITGAQWGHLDWWGSEGTDAQDGDVKPVDFSYDKPDRWLQDITLSVDGVICDTKSVTIFAWQPDDTNPPEDGGGFPVPSGYVAPFTYGAVDNAILPVTNWFDPTHVYELWGLDGAFMHGKDGWIAIDNFRQDKVLPGQTYSIIDATAGTSHTLYINNPWGPKDKRFCLASDDQEVILGAEGYCVVIDK